MKATARYRYQLVFQFPCNRLEDFDAFVALEEQFITAIRDDESVDGHDCGSGEFNTFVHTNAPRESFARLRPVLAAALQLDHVRVAYREFGSASFSIIWPEADHAQFAIA